MFTALGGFFVFVLIAGERPPETPVFAIVLATGMAAALMFLGILTLAVSFKERWP